MRAEIVGITGGLFLCSLASGCGGREVPNELKVAISDVQSKLTQVRQKFRGASFPVSDDSGVTTTLHSFLAKGSSGYARVNALLAYRTHEGTLDENGNPAAPAINESCPDTCDPNSDPTKPCKYGVDLVSMTWVQTYNDGSAFTGAVPNDPEDGAKWNKYFKQSFVCTNGRDFYIEAKGVLVDGLGTRFDRLNGGEWIVKAKTSTYLTDGCFKAINLSYTDQAASQSTGELDVKCWDEEDGQP